ncbi:MAG: polyprenyl synthetase family protein [Thermoanaerobaculia bacterium]|nr:polyprenyl synthetase family protein [Thermoanaerobaculia bacterium]MBP9825747.1 polyprenyl synthetase family protein [Thermoanaerobaculia bacterium]
MRAAVLSPGKRVRPMLTLAVAEMLGGASDDALDLACAVELVHCCSLVLDDLPAMDDAHLRRGRPTLHREHGEDVALLAAFALLNRGYALVAESSQRLHLSRYSPEELLHHLAQAIGTDGLIGGQAMDLANGGAPPTLADLEYIHSHKTGALFLAAAELGAMAVDARRRDLAAIGAFAKNLGLAFQIEDDLLDVLATSAETGKDEGQDASKVTFVKLLGVAGARSLADELLAFALASVAPFGRKAEVLCRLVEFVAGYGNLGSRQVTLTGAGGGGRTGDE